MKRESYEYLIKFNGKWALNNVKSYDSVTYWRGFFDGVVRASCMDSDITPDDLKKLQKIRSEWEELLFNEYQRRVREK